MVKPIVNYRHPQDVWKWSSPNGRFFMGKTSIVKLKICQCMSAEIDRHWLNNSQPIQNTKKLPCRRGKKNGRDISQSRDGKNLTHRISSSHGNIPWRWCHETWRWIGFWEKPKRCQMKAPHGNCCWWQLMLWSMNNHDILSISKFASYLRHFFVSHIIHHHCRSDKY